jgi:amino acid transporter
VSLTEIKRFFLGNPLASHVAEHEKLPVVRALPVFSSDALSSVAYATEEILLILVGVSTAATYWGFPIAMTIAALLVIVSASYRQTIALYPNGGGAYIVSMENLGQTPGLLAGGALMIDYILTVAVSVSAGVAAMSSAFPWVGQHSIVVSSLLILVLTVSNLRGLRESSFLFSVPTYLFIGMMGLLLGFGAFRVLTHDPVTETGIIPLDPVMAQNIGIFALLKAFSSGCAALTGIEAISNGVPAFRQPAVKNAKRTMTIMVLLLGLFFLGVSFLARHYAIVPVANETVLSQIGRRVFGSPWLYYTLQVATAAILCLAANTAYADFPRLASILAHDRYLPRQLHNIGDRLVFSNGIVTLGVAACVLVVLFGADTHGLVPLYSVGVFLSFTLSQTGMVMHHLKYRETHWKKGLILNLTGAVSTFVVLLVVAVTKFTSGAWITLVVIPSMLMLFRAIKRHYLSVAVQLKVDESWRLDSPQPSLVLIPISGFHSGVLKALQYARGLSQDIRLLVVDVEPRITENIRKAYQRNVSDDPNVRLEILDSPYRSVVEPVAVYAEHLSKEFPGRTTTVLIPQFVTKRWWHNFLHNQTAFFLKTRLRTVERIVVTAVSYHLKD